MGEGRWQVAQVLGQLGGAQAIVAYLDQGPKGGWEARGWLAEPLRRHLSRWQPPTYERVSGIFDEPLQRGIRLTPPLAGLGRLDEEEARQAGGQIQGGIAAVIALGALGKLVVWLGVSRAPDAEAMAAAVAAFEAAACDPLCFYKDFIENLQALFVVISPEGKLLHVNQYIAQLGYERQDVIGLDVGAMLAPGEWLRLRSALDRSPQLKRFRALVRHASGELSVMELMVSLSGMRGECAPLTLALGCDLRQESQLGHYRRLQAVERMISGVAHELNNPLQTVVGNAEMLAGMKLPDSAHRRAQRVYAGAKRCQEVVDGMLKIKRRRRELADSLHLEELLRRTCRAIEGEFEQLAVRASVEVEGELPGIKGNMIDLEQAFENVLRNAFQAVAEQDGPRVEVSIVSTGEAVQVTVADNGCGLSEEVLDRAFEPFFSTRGVGAGKGLGLSIALGIVQEHGGFIELQSGQGGTRALITLPVDGYRAY